MFQSMMLLKHVWLAEKQNTNKEIYNVASGFNVTAKQITDVIEKETACKVNWHDGNFLVKSFLLLT